MALVLERKAELSPVNSGLADLLEPAYRASFDVSPNSLQMAGLAFNEQDLANLRGLEEKGFVMVFRGKEYLREGYKITREGKEWYERNLCLQA